MAPSSPPWTPPATRSSAPRSARDWMSGVPDPDLVIDVHQATVTRGGKDLIRAVDWRGELDERRVGLGPHGGGQTTPPNLAAGPPPPAPGTGGGPRGRPRPGGAVEL